MNDIRAKFEEIWPVPEGVAWSMNIGCYVCNDAVRMTQESINKCIEWDIRLDTFTRCQEMMAPVMSLVDEMAADIRYRAYHDADDEDDEKSKALLYRAKQIFGAKE